MGSTRPTALSSCVPAAPGGARRSTGNGDPCHTGLDVPRDRVPRTLPRRILFFLGTVRGWSGGNSEILGEEADGGVPRPGGRDAGSRYLERLHATECPSLLEMW